MPDIPPQDELLRDDVRRLGAVVGDMLRAQEGDAFFDLVESTRVNAQKARDGDAQAGTAMEQRLAAADLATREKLVRAFSAFFSAVNMGEQIHRIRRRRAYERAGPQRHSPQAVFAALKADGFEAEQVRQGIQQLAIEPVFTAHPTEAVRRTLLTKQQRVARALVDRIEPGALTPVEEQRAWDRIREEVTAAWQTEEHFAERPTLSDETEHVMFYLSRVIYRIVPSFYEALEAAFEAVFGEALECPAFVRFGSWVGGDMDGNPNVNAATIEATLNRHRETVLRLYIDEASQLMDRLSQSESRIGFSAPLRSRLRELVGEWPKIIDHTPARHRDMPYRLLLRCITAKLKATLREDRQWYASADDLHADVKLIADSLAENAGEQAGLHHVRRWLRHIETFGFHFATLDVRQDSEVHRSVCGALLEDEEFAQRGAAERASLLHDAFATGASRSDDAESAATLDVFRTILRGRRVHGERAFGPYIISMAQAADDVLAVLFLARHAGLIEGDDVPLDIAPLFETVDDLTRAPATLADMLADPIYREHLKARGDRQYVMLGYSDSGKDSGIAAARWALYRAQEELVEVARQAGIRLILFHGRGGTVSRGGTKVTEAIPAQPPGSVQHRLRVTEQGEIIHARYGLRGIAQRTLEVMSGAVLAYSAREQRIEPPCEEWRAIMQTLANASRQAYRALVHDDPRLFPYFQAATPIDLISRLLIGSRPPSRRAQQGIGDLRAIPWVFAWTQSRLTLTGWYGVGEGLQAAIKLHGMEAVRQAAREWPVLRALLGDVEMVMAKSDLGISERYAALADDAALFGELKQAFAITRKLLLEVREERELLQHEPWLARAIRLRNPYIDPMSLTQVELLQEWRKSGRKDRALESALFTTVKGIARGLMNTG